MGFVGAHSDKKEAKGAYGGKFKFSWIGKNFQLDGYGQNISRHFDISQIGFFPWVGRKELDIQGGPVFYNKGAFKRISASLKGWWQREFAEPYPEYSAHSILDLSLVNNWGISSEFVTGKRFEEGQRYRHWHADFWMWSDSSRPFFTDFGFEYDSQSYNYRRNYFAPIGEGELSLRWRVNPGLQLGFSVSNTTEFKPDGSVEKVNWISHPTVDWALRKDLFLRVWSEPNFATDIHRVNILLSWDFQPKSWIYLAYNESRDNTQGKMKLKDRIAVFKVRYLFLL